MSDEEYEKECDEVECVTNLIEEDALPEKEKRLLARLIMTQRSQLRRIEKSLTEHVDYSEGRLRRIESDLARVTKALFGTDEDTTDGLVNIHRWICRSARFVIATLATLAAVITWLIHTVKDVGWL